MPEFILAGTEKEYTAAALLFKEYAAWLNIDLGFQNFEKEMQELDKMYSHPEGGIILCKHHDEYIGCVGVRKIDEVTAEMKRMWVKTSVQGKGLGTELLNKAIILARECGYKKIRLDTLNSMIPAMTLYHKNGFIEIPPYYNNPDERAVYFEKEL
jgi:carbonic anhydrase